MADKCWLECIETSGGRALHQVTAMWTTMKTKMVSGGDVTDFWSDSFYFVVGCTGDMSHASWWLGLDKYKCCRPSVCWQCHVDLFFSSTLLSSSFILALTNNPPIHTWRRIPYGAVPCTPAPQSPTMFTCFAPCCCRRFLCVVVDVDVANLSSELLACDSLVAASGRCRKCCGS